MTRLVLLVLLVLLLPSAAGAGVSPQIVHGVESGPDQNSTVLVMHYDALAKGGGAASGCSGTLLTPRLVLTARHCVAETDLGAACDSAGRPVAGGKVTRDRDPGAIFVFGGHTRPDFLAGTADPVKGLEILTTGATTICNNDIALVLLERPVANAVIAPVRLDSGATPGEIIKVAGWGISESDENPPARRERTGIPVLEVGPGPALGPAEFRIGEGTCKGDSGGPAIAPSGAVLGALSRGGNDGDASGAAGCLGGENIFTSVSAHADLVREGYAAAGQKPWLEGEPNPLLERSPAPDGGCVMVRPPPADCPVTPGSVLAVLLACACRKKQRTSRACERSEQLPPIA